MKLASPKESLFLSTLIGRSAGWFANIFVVSPCYCFQGDSFFTLTGSCCIFVRSEMFVNTEYWGCDLTVSIFSWICSVSCVLSRKHFWKWDGFRWWSKDTVAVVTGANKGIGFEIVRQLAKEGITVVLTARDETRGKEALNLWKVKSFTMSIFILLMLLVKNPCSHLQTGCARLMEALTFL